MARVASLFLPQLAIERLRRNERSRAQPERAAPLLPVDDDPGACSVPRGGGWRPGARWARDGKTRADVAADPLTGKKTKHWFSVPSRPIFAFAGVWRSVGEGAAYAFLTCGYGGDPAGHVVGTIHPKAMPVILHEEDYERWLRASLDGALPLACAFPSKLMI